MSNVNFIIAQILGLTATFILCFSYMVKSKKGFLLLGILGDVVYGLSFIFVNSLGTGLITMLSCLQFTCFYLFDKKGKVMPKYIAGIFATSFVVIGVVTMQSLWDIIPILIYIWFTFTLYLNDVKKIRIMYVFPNLILAVYDTMVMAYASAFEDGFEATFLAVVIIIDYAKSKNVNKGLKNRATLTKFNSMLSKIMGVDNNLQSALINVETSDNQTFSKQKNQKKFIPQLILQGERPKAPH